MGFSEGLEDDFLLTCFVCKSPFGMLASFCGECGCRRDQALGIERASTQQQIVNNDLTEPSYYEQAPDANVIPEYEEIFATPGTPPPPPVKQKSIKSQMRRQNRAIRLEKLNDFQERNARKLNFVGGFLFLVSSYMLVQSFIFAQSSPLATAEDILQKGAHRDSSYFTDLGADSSTKFFPANYSKWGASNAVSWVTNYESNGWSGNATVFTTPSGSQYDDISIELPLKAIYSTKFGIFRQIEWAPANPPATLTIDYPYGSSTAIYINGLAAGTVNKPAVREGTYWVYPGPMEVTYYSYGSETEDSFSYFIDAFGDYSSY
jgi:hypothetical protein